MPGGMVVPVGAGASPDNTGASQGPLTNVADTLVMSISGAQYASLRVLCISSGTAQLDLQFSIDGGRSYPILNVDAGAGLTGVPKGRVLTAPNMIAIFARTFNVGDLYDVPLPANVTHVRLRVSTGGTVVQMALMPGLPYVPGVPVTAVLCNKNNGLNAAMDSQPMILSGWREVYFRAFASAGTTALTVSTINDDISGGTNDATPALAPVALIYQAGGWGPGCVSPFGATYACGLPLPPGLRFVAGAAGAGNTSNLMIVARR